MAKSTMSQSTRHHHTPEFYLKQFAELMFGDSLRVFEQKTGRWDPNRRTPKGIGWSRFLYSSYNLAGERVDDFERFLSEYVDTPCAEPMKKAAANPENLTEEERVLIALFVGFAAARTRNLIEAVEQKRLESDPTDEELLKLWCDAIKKPLTSDTDRQLLRSTLFRAVVVCAVTWQQRILPWKWHFMRASRENPFITTDWPAAGTFDNGHYLLTFPISSEVALLTSSHPEVGIPNRGIQDIRGINARTLWRSTRFVVCHKDSFPGDEALPGWAKAR